ncbi:MAG: type II toxin-antitoxin system prevent-host-death family antitoxin [Gammaproteobacteria bacterium]|nr:type II toxin-antitoxin system prevent-host-death family antitoxin [Gammaproteobacteria bacterium]MBU1443753.1 type II toxin-antitoxin system prevent-host-death family antitoxin [Gammaproteobacteria bacterium]MBU2286981.1 type II toxin-antitoxin system prevent-host-death family antitoxin [Gammaproteobacteria bacterium]MBU2409788.1 type II toxin-antitoxin system prevent-host-death family antitoxin [Gammaproteobacteria bacterium]
MSIHSIPSRDFARDVGRAKRLATQGPVLITDRGKPAFALLKIEDYYELSGGLREMSLLELMDSLPRTADEFVAPKADIGLQVPDFD